MKERKQQRAILNAASGRFVKPRVTASFAQWRDGYRGEQEAAAERGRQLIAAEQEHARSCESADLLARAEAADEARFAAEAELARVAGMLGSASRAAGEIHARLLEYVSEKDRALADAFGGAGDGAGESTGAPSGATTGGAGGHSASRALALIGRLRELDQLASCALDTARQPAAFKADHEAMARADERYARVNTLAVRQQRQLVGLRARLERTDRRVLALAGRDQGRALLLAEQQAAAAEQAARARDDELAAMRDSLGALEFIAAPARGGRGEVEPMSEELQQFVVEQARETASLKEQLARLRASVVRSDRAWGALERERDELRAMARNAESEVALARREAGADAERLRAQLAEVNSDVARMERQLGELASAGADSSRRKAAEYLVHKLREVRSSAAESLRQADEARERSGAARMRAVLGSGAAPTVAAIELELQQAQDAARELREQIDPARAAQQMAVQRVLFKELHDERKARAELEATLAWGEDAELEAAGNGALEVGGPSERVLAQLLHGKELQLHAMEAQLAQLQELAAVDPEGVGVDNVPLAVDATAAGPNIEAAADAMLVPAPPTPVAAQAGAGLVAAAPSAAQSADSRRAPSPNAADPSSGSGDAEQQAGVCAATAAEPSTDPSTAAAPESKEPAPVDTDEAQS